MENNQALDDNFAIGLSITPDIREFLEDTAKWAHFLSILGFIFVGLLIVIALFAGTFLGLVISEMQNEISGVSSLIITVIYFAIAGLYLLPIIYLYRFSNNLKQALLSDNQHVLSLAFKNLKAHYKFIGILTSIILGFYTLTIIFTIFFNALMF